MGEISPVGVDLGRVIQVHASFFVETPAFAGAGGT
jgi:hypothetical protein